MTCREFLRLISHLLILIYSLWFDLQTKESSNNVDIPSAIAESSSEPEANSEGQALSEAEPESESAIPEVEAEGW